MSFASTYSTAVITTVFAAFAPSHVSAFLAAFKTAVFSTVFYSYVAAISTTVKEAISTAFMPSIRAAFFATFISPVETAIVSTILSAILSADKVCTQSCRWPRHLGARGGWRFVIFIFIFILGCGCDRFTNKWQRVGFMCSITLGEHGPTPRQLYCAGGG